MRCSSHVNDNVHFCCGVIVCLGDPGVYEFRAPESLDPGSVVGVIQAVDADIGENAAMDYRISSSDGAGMFDIHTNRSTQEGVITLRKVRTPPRYAAIINNNPYNRLTDKSISSQSFKPQDRKSVV